MGRVPHEIGPGRLAALAGIEPFLVMAGRAIELLRRAAELAGLALGDQPVAIHLRLVADDHKPVTVGKRSIGLQLIRPGWLQPAVPPGERYRRAVAFGREVPTRDRGQRRGLVGHFRPIGMIRRARLDRVGMPELEGLEGRRELVAADIAQATGTEVPPAAPGERMVAGMIGSHRRGADPQIPVEPSRHRRPVAGTRTAPLGNHRNTVRTGVDLADRAQRTRPDRLANQPRFFAGLPKVAHLRGDLGHGGLVADLAGFIDRVCQRLLAMYMLMHLHGHQRRRRVDVVRRGHGHCVDVVAGLQHLAIISE